MLKVCISGSSFRTIRISLRFPYGSEGRSALRESTADIDRRQAECRLHYASGKHRSLRRHWRAPCCCHVVLHVCSRRSLRRSPVHGQSLLLKKPRNSLLLWNIKGTWPIPPLSNVLSSIDIINIFIICFSNIHRNITPLVYSYSPQ